MNEFHEEDEEYFCRFTFGQFVSLALLEFVALFFVFYLGARYGPELMGLDTAPRTERLATLPGEDPYDGEAAQAPKPIEYTYPEVLTRKEAIRQPVRETRAPAPEPKKVEAPAPAAQPVARAPAPSPVPATRDGYAIQVGSYRQASGAADKISQWQAKGYDAFLSIGEVPNSGTWYRVRIGHFETRESARKFLEDVVRKEKVSAIIVRSNG